jgi:SNF2 family DNA or RNA helicase
VDHLDQIEIALGKEGIKSERLDGTMPEKQRHEAIRRFERHRTTLVFLATIGAGGVGITLTAANHVFIMEPGWNPQAEEQAVDRVHRVGQQQPVRVLRLVAKDTIEGEIRRYAVAKAKLASVVLDQKLAKKEDRNGVFKQLELMLKKGAGTRRAWQNRGVEDEEKEKEDEDEESVDSEVSDEE